MPDPWQTYLVEHYRPGLTVEALRRATGVVRAAAGAMAEEGRALRYVGSTIIPTDEGSLSFFEAASERDVRDAYVRAGEAFDRISEALPADD